MGGRGRCVIKVGRLSPTSITTRGRRGRGERQGLIQRGAERGARGVARLGFPCLCLADPITPPALALALLPPPASRPLPGI